MFEISDEKSYILVKASGKNELKDFIDTIHKQFTRPEFPCRDDIWVFGEEIIDLNYEQLATITEFIASIYPADATRTKTALVVPDGLNSAIVELWAGTTTNLPYEARIFSSLTEAEEWLAA